MKVLKQLIFMFMALMMLSCISIGASAADCKLYYDIEFEENFIFDKYDVELYLDSEKVADIPHGQRFSKMTEVNAGHHKVIFYSKDDEEVFGEQEFELSGDASFVCKIAAESKEVEISNFELSEDLSASSLVVPEVTYRRLSEVIDELKEAGFLNVLSQTEDGGKVKDEKESIIVEQSVEAGKAIDQNDELTLICKKTQDFLDELFVEKNAGDAISTAEEYSYYLMFIDSLNERSIQNELSDTPDKMKDWVVESASLAKGNQKMVNLNMKYTGNSNIPNITGMGMDYALKELRACGFSMVAFMTMDGDDIKEKNISDYYAVKADYEVGKEVAVDTEIALYGILYSELDVADLDNLMISVDEVQTEAETETETEKVTETETEIVTEKQTETEKVTEKITEPETEKQTEKITEKQTETEPPTEKIYTDAETIKQVQTKLNALGYDCGTPDGIAGTRTQDAIQKYASANGLVAAGAITESFLSKLNKEKIPETERVVETTEAPTSSGIMVWIPTNGGTKYHSKSSCSKMQNPDYVSIDQAQSMGFGPCGRCM